MVLITINSIPKLPIVSMTGTPKLVLLNDPNYNKNYKFVHM